MLIANKDYNPGDVIFTEVPFICILLSQHRGQRCDSCLQEFDYLKACSGCRFLNFCTKECQKQDWKAHHKYEECKVFKKIKDDQVVESFDRRMLAIRVYLTLRGRPELKDKKFEMPDGSSRSFHETMTNEEHLKNSPGHYLSFLMVSELLSSVVSDLIFKNFPRCSVVSA